MDLDLQAFLKALFNLTDSPNSKRNASTPQSVLRAMLKPTNRNDGTSASSMHVQPRAGGAQRLLPVAELKSGTRTTGCGRSPTRCATTTPPRRVHLRVARRARRGR